MRIGELAKRADVSRDTIRFYERRGLISSLPGNELTNSYRDYPEDCVLTLDLIRQAKSAGLSLEDLETFIQQFDAHDPSDFDGDAFLDQKIDEIERRIAASEEFLKTLRQTKKALHDSP